MWQGYSLAGHPGRVGSAPRASASGDHRRREAKLTRDLEEKAAEAVELARRGGAQAAEAYVIDDPRDTVALTPSGERVATRASASPRSGVSATTGAHAAAIPALGTAITIPHRGLGLTAQWGDRVGFASTTVLSSASLGDLVGECRGAATPVPTADPPLCLTPPARPSPADGLIDPHIVEMNLPELAALARKVGEQVIQAGAAALEVVALSSCRRVAVANSLGHLVSSLDTSVAASVYAASPGGGFGGILRVSRSIEGLRRLDPGREAAELAKSGDGERDVVPGRQVVILRPDALLSLFANSLGPALGADRAVEGLSPFATLGAVVASDIITIVDDATRPGAPCSYSFDAEGTAAGVTPVIDRGRLVSLLHTNQTARPAVATAAATGPAGLGGTAGRRSTGNASRDRSERMSTFVEPSGYFGYRPGAMPSTLVVTSENPVPDPAASGSAGGAGTPALALDFSALGVDRGLLVAGVMGAFVIDPAVGDFSVTTTNAWAIESGRAAYPVRRAMLTGNVYTMLRQAVGFVGQPSEAVGPFGLVSPAWIVDGLTVV